MALVDLFCCNGGFALGAHQAGFKVAAAYDLDPSLTSAFQVNFPQTELQLRDISTLTGPQVRDQVGRRITGIFGGPPCQAFSDMGRRDPNDPRRQLLWHFYRLVSELQPDFFIMENVRGLGTGNSRDLLDASISQISDNYRLLGPLLLDAADFGAATRRVRLFVVGVHRDQGDALTEEHLSKFRKPAVTVREAIGDMADATQIDLDGDRWQLHSEVPSGSYAASMRAPDRTFDNHRIVRHREDVARRFASLPQGKIDPIGRHPRLAWEGQCPTLRAGTGSDRGSFQAVRPLHPTVDRVITVREAARLQGFPDSHKFHPAVWHSFRMIGNSVSPLISRAIFSALASKIHSHEHQPMAA